MREDKFNPGSDSALERGCACPVIDNHFGKGRPDGTFIYSGECKYHNEDLLTKEDKGV